MSFKYKAFISYSHADRRWAKWLHGALERYRAPKNLVGTQTSVGPIPPRLVPIFRDREELPSAPDLTRRIKEALRESENLIVICSPSAAKSSYVDQEIESFKKLGRSDRIFSIIVDGEPGSEDPETDCFPPSLRVRYDANGNSLPGDEEPIAADARKHCDGRSLAQLKVIAGMIGVGLDDLRQRELQRKQRRMAAITLASLVAFAVTAILAISAYVARNEANKRREQAEDLLSFMVVDLRESLTPIGRLDLLEQVGEKAMSYFATVKVRDLTDEELIRHAQVMTQIGEIRMSQRQYDNALTSFMEAYDRSAELAKNNPADGDPLFGRGQAEFWVGYVHWRRGDFDSAHEWLTRYRDSSQSLSELDPGRADWAREVAYGDHNLAVLALESGDLDAADTGFRGELRVLLALQERDSSLEMRRDIADIVSWLGNIAFQRGQLAEARQHYERAARDYRALLLEEPDNASRQDDWAYSMHWIAEIAALTGDIDQANKHIDETIAVFEKLMLRDNENKEWMRAGSRSWTLKGRLLAARGELEGARTFASKSTTLYETLVAEEVSDLAAREQLADAYHLLTWVEYAAGDFTAALEANLSALTYMKLVQGDGRLNDERLGKLGSITVFQGQLQAALGQQDQAKKTWQQAAELIADRVRTTQTPLLIDPWIRALMLSDQREDAQDIIDKLEASMYQPLRPWPEVAR